MICIVKLAVLWLYKRVFSPKPGSPFDIAITLLVVILIGFYGSTTFVKIFECNPRAKIADSSIPGHCVDLSTVLKTSGSFNFITDFLILFLPVHAVWKLRMSRRKKALVVFVFTFGLWYVWAHGIQSYELDKARHSLTSRTTVPRYLPPSASSCDSETAQTQTSPGGSPKFSFGGKQPKPPLSPPTCTNHL